MGATIAAIGVYFGGTGAAAAGTAAAGAATAGAAGAGAASGLGTALGTAAVSAAAGAAANALLAPDAPKAKPGPAMPDPEAQEAARRRAIAEQIGRRGRASTFLSDNPSGKLGG
jgi:hypothetical protein